MAEYIDRDAVCSDCKNQKVCVDKSVCPVGRAPAADVEVVKHGRWEKRKDVIGFVRCSVCHDCNIYDDWPDGKKWGYCPNCGAKMDLEG